jgi:SAM-dependent methyltransferase
MRIQSVPGYHALGKLSRAVIGKHVIDGLLTLMSANTRAADHPIQSSRYYYSIWLRHLVAVNDAIPFIVPKRVAELGPGNSLGAGISALLCGAQQYIGLDLTPLIFKGKIDSDIYELAKLVREQTPIPDNVEFPGIQPALASYKFPSPLLPAEVLRESAGIDRVYAIKEALRSISQGGGESVIKYFAPWMDTTEIEAGSIDYLFSQAVMEHVDDLALSYATMYKLLRPGAVMSHQIDFRSHGTADAWNGHWSYSDLKWKLIRGAREYLINRQTISAHRAAIRNVGFEIVNERLVTDNTGIGRGELAKPFLMISEEDFKTSGAFIVAVKR